MKGLLATGVGPSPSAVGVRPLTGEGAGRTLNSSENVPKAGTILLIMLAFLVPCAAQEAEPYAWPLDLPRVLTSSFAEYRPGRFHMGIDLRTGSSGHVVHAAEDGYVSRVRCSPWGYGKAVYLTLADGNTVIYAHLSDFADELGAFVRRAQHERESYTVDLYPAPNAFPVKRGAIIAKSGQTGIGVPHLHYEIRDSSGRPINPRGLGITWPDSTSPEIQNVLLIPAGPNTLLNGDYFPLIVSARSLGEGRYGTDPVETTGPVLLGVEMVDKAAPASPRLGVRILRTSVGGSTIFELRKDRLAYEDIGDGAVAYHPYFLDKGRFLLPWRWPGNDSEFFRISEADGRIEGPREASEVELVAEDFLGNRATLTVPLRLGPDAGDEEPGGPASVGSEGQVETDCFGGWLVVTAHFAEREGGIPVLVSEDGEGSERQAFRRINATTFRATFAPSADTREVVLHVDHPGVEPSYERYAVVRRGEGDRRFELGGLGLHVKSKSPYGVLFLRVAEVDADLPSSEQSLRLRGRAYAVWHRDAPIDEPVTLSFPIPDGKRNFSRLLVYRETSKGWAPQDTVTREGRFEVTTRFLGTFAVMEDVSPPSIRIVSPPNEGIVTSRRPSIRVAVTDRGSDIEGYSIRCNGAWLLAEYDPERGLLKWERDEDLPLGAVELAVVVRDRAGNVAETRRKITVSP